MAQRCTRPVASSHQTEPSMRAIPRDALRVRAHRVRLRQPRRAPARAARRLDGLRACGPRRRQSCRRALVTCERRETRGRDRGAPVRTTRVRRSPRSARRRSHPVHTMARRRTSASASPHANPTTMTVAAGPRDADHAETGRYFFVEGSRSHVQTATAEGIPMMLEAMATT
jgi:hypothetical protein